MRVNNSIRSYEAKTTSSTGLPYLRMAGGYFPLTSETATGTHLKLRLNDKIYRIRETYTTTRETITTTGTTAYTRSSTVTVTCKTRASTSATAPLTRSSTYSTSYLTQQSTSSIDYGTVKKYVATNDAPYVVFTHAYNDGKEKFSFSNLHTNAIVSIRRYKGSNPNTSNATGYAVISSGFTNSTNGYHYQLQFPISLSLPPYGNYTTETLVANIYPIKETYRDAVFTDVGYKSPNYAYGGEVSSHWLTMWLSVANQTYAHTTGTTYRTRSSTYSTKYLTQVSTSGTTNYTRSSAYDTGYVTAASTSATGNLTTTTAETITVSD